MHLKPLLVAFILTAATSAHADPVRATSGSGSVFLGPVVGESQLFLDIFVDHLHLTGENHRDEPASLDIITVLPDPLLVGAVANVSSRSTFIAEGTLNGKFVNWDGQLTFVTPDTLLSGDTRFGGECCKAVASFQFDGLLHASDLFSEAHLADFRIRGQGQATGFFSPEPREDLLYVFSQTNLVPEPSSLLLVGSVILGGAVRRWRRAGAH